MSEGENQISLSQFKQRALKKLVAVSSEVGRHEPEETQNKAFRRYYHKFKEVDDSGDCYIYRTAIKSEIHVINVDDLKSKTMDHESSLPAPLIRVKLLDKEYLAELDGSGTYCFINQTIATKARALDFKTKTENRPVDTSNGVTYITESTTLHISWVEGSCEMKFYILLHSK
jgi:hypothetical protein